MTSGPTIRRYELVPEVGGGYRFTVEDPAAIKIGESSITEKDGEKLLLPSNLLCWNEAGARQRSFYSDAQLDEIDWRELERLSSRMSRFIRGNLAVAKLGSYPILRHAYSAMADGLKLWIGRAIAIGSREITVNTAPPKTRSKRSRRGARTSG